MKKFFKVIGIIFALLIVIAVATSCVNENDTSEVSNDPVAVSNETSNDTAIVEEAETKSEATIGQKNALRSAEAYLDYMAFSYSGLIDQLEYEGFSTEDATYAADNCGADWNEQAAKSAEAYLDYMAFSKDGLIEQLQYEGFTYEQAVYGAEANGY